MSCSARPAPSHSEPGLAGGLNAESLAASTDSVGSPMRKLAIRRVGQCRAHLSMVDCQTDRTYGDRSESLVT